LVADNKKSRRAPGKVVGIARGRGRKKGEDSPIVKRRQGGREGKGGERGGKREEGEKLRGKKVCL